MSVDSELQKIVDIKENQRSYFSISSDVPFHEYIEYAKWGDDTVPPDGEVFQFYKKRYSSDGAPVSLETRSTFERDSVATHVVNGKSVTVGKNIPRISRSGLLLEPASGVAERAADILRISTDRPKNISGDWDEGVTYEMRSTEIIFSGNGYIRELTMLDWDDSGVVDGGKYLDFIQGVYLLDGTMSSLRQVANFSRLSGAMFWTDGDLREVGVDVPRIDSQGLLLERQLTNSYPNNYRYNDYWEGLKTIEKNILDNDPITGESVQFVSDSRVSTNTHISNPLGKDVRGNILKTMYIRKGTVRHIRLNNSSRHGFTLDTETGKPVEVNGTDTISIVDLGTWWQMNISSDVTADGGTHYDFVYGNGGLATLRRINVLQGDNIFTAYPFMGETTELTTTPIRTESTPVTRMADFLRVDVAANQTISGDWDSDITYKIVDGVAQFTGHGRIRTIYVDDV